MAIYHFEAKVITRGTDRSVVAAAAYASCSQIYNDYDGINHDYTRKQGCVYSEIFLPTNVPTEWQDRAELWNAVEAAEKSKDSQLARELIVALPIELQIDEWKSILKTFITENCVDKGMCADVSIHDTDGHNPHAHILLTMRPLDDKGKWQAKTQKEYLCKRGDDEQGFTADEFKSAQADGWEKQYQYFVGKKKIYMTPSEAKAQSLERASKNPKSTRYGRQNPICAEWNSEEQITVWRKAWEDVTNVELKRKNALEHIDCRSFKDRGIDEQPTIHEGVTARIIEQRGGVSERCEMNRQIRKDNALLRELKALVNKLSEVVENTTAKIVEELENIRNNLIMLKYKFIFNKKQIKQVETEKQLIPNLIKQFRELSDDIEDKTAEYKKTKAEKNACSPLNIFRQSQLSKQLEVLSKEIKELKSDKKFVLFELGCKTDNDIDIIEQNYKYNLDVAEKLKVRNSDLKSEYTTEKANYIEIKNNIQTENTEAVQAERTEIQAGGIRQTRIALENTYKGKFDDDIFAEAQTAVNNDLYEKPLRKSLVWQLQRELPQQKPFFRERRNYEHEQ
jgi:hypothetical protein